MKHAGERFCLRTSGGEPDQAPCWKLVSDSHVLPGKGAWEHLPLKQAGCSEWISDGAQYQEAGMHPPHAVKLCSSPTPSNLPGPCGHQYFNKPWV